MPETEIDEDVDVEAKKLEERLKSALWFSIGKIVDSESINLGVNATPQFIGSLTELVWTQVENTSSDLESFAHHAHRSTINTEDVMLLARRNEGLESILKDFVQKLKEKREMEYGEDNGGRSKNKGGTGNGTKGGRKKKKKKKKKKRDDDGDDGLEEEED